MTALLHVFRVFGRDEGCWCPDDGPMRGDCPDHRQLVLMRRDAEARRPRPYPTSAAARDRRGVDHGRQRCTSPVAGWQVRPTPAPSPDPLSPPLPMTPTNLGNGEQGQQR